MTKRAPDACLKFEKQAMIPVVPVDSNNAYKKKSSFNLSLLSPSCPDAIYVSIQFLKVRVEKYEGRSLQRFREISSEGEI